MARRFTPVDWGRICTSTAAGVGCALVAQPASGGQAWRGERATYAMREQV